MLACVCQPARAHNLPRSLEIAPRQTNSHLYTNEPHVITKETGNAPVIENEIWDASKSFSENGYVWSKESRSSSSESSTDSKKSDKINNNHIRTLDRNGNIQKEKMRPLEKIPKGELDLGSPCKVPKTNNNKVISSETIHGKSIITNSIKPNNLTKNKDIQNFSNKSSPISQSTKPKLSSSLSNPLSSTKEKSSSKTKSSTLPSRNKSSSSNPTYDENGRSITSRKNNSSKSSYNNSVGGRGGSCGSSSCSSSSKSSSQGSPLAGGGRGGSCGNSSCSSISSGRGSTRERSSASGSSSSSSPSNSLKAARTRTLPLRPPGTPVRTTSLRDAPQEVKQEVQPVGPPPPEEDKAEILDDIKFPLPELPDGCELTVGELHDMASHQQQQIETQQQLLVAREQRLKYLKQQDTRAHQVHQEAERLRRLRERVDAQEAKLRRLRALRGQVEATRMNTASLTTDLDAMRHLFSEKEKELVVAVGKVEELTHQLEDLRQGRSAVNPNNQHHNELDKLRRELLYRNSVNREASARVAQQRETLATRRDEITKIDKRIAELQQRLHRKRLLNTQLASQITAATQAKQAQLKAVQNKAMRDGGKEHSIDDSHVQHLKIPSGEELGEFGPNKHDPKYQTLPYNTKFLMGPNNGREQSWESDGSMHSSEYPPGGEQGYPGSGANMGSTEEMANSNGVNSTVVRTVHSIPTSVASRGLAHAPQPHQLNAATAQPGNPAMNPRVYGSAQSQNNARSQPLGGSSQGINQGVENVRAMDSNNESVSPEDSGGDGRNRPALPPKPAVPSKPLPPPRQKGDPLLSSTESLNTLHQTPPQNKNMSPGYRYGSQNSITSTHTSGADNQEGTEDNNRPSNANNNNNNVISKREGEGEKVHVSINRRIEMPPDFMFPEDETPPSDLLGQRVKEIENNNVESRLENGLDSVDNMQALSVPYSELEKLRIDVSKDEKSIQDEYYNNNVSYNTPAMDESRQPDGADTPVALQEGHIDGEAQNMNNNNLNNSTSNINTQVVRRIKKGNLKTKNSNRVTRRVSFDPLALLLDASLEGELELVRRTAMEVSNPSAANDEGITALHNAICAGHLDIVTFLVTFGCDVNAQDSDGWTPLHCAASCNNVAMVRFLVEHGACILATTLSDHETAAEKCEQDEEGYDGCSQYLYSVQEKLGIMNGGLVYSVYDYEAQASDELDMGYNDSITILRRGDEYEREWWWGRNSDKQGYVPRNLLGLYPRVKNPLRDS